MPDGSSAISAISEMESPMAQDANSISAEDRKLLRNLLTAVMATQLMTPFLQTGVAVLLPALGEYYQCSAASLSMVSTIYCMATAIFSLAWGRGGDKWGRRRVCLISMCMVVPTSLLISVSPTIEGVIGMRFVQGLGTSGIFTSALAMLVACSPPGLRGRMLGLSTTAVYIGVSLGPLLGGYINALWGWQTFFRLIGLWAAGCFFIMFFLVRREWHEDRDKPYDWRGLMLFGTGMGSLVMGLIGPLTTMPRVICALAGIVLLWYFGRCEARLTKTPPLLDVSVLFHNKLFVLSNLSALTLFASLFSVSFYLSLYLQYARGMNSAEAGAAIFILSVVQILCIMPSSFLSERIGSSAVAFLGNILAALSLVMLLFLTPSSSMAYIYTILVLNGMGMGLFATPNTVLIMSSVDKAHLSQASGCVGTMRTAGMMSSMVIATFSLRLCMGETPMSVDVVPQFMNALRLSFAIFLACNVVSLLCAGLRMPMTRAGRMD